MFDHTIVFRSSFFAKSIHISNGRGSRGAVSQNIHVFTQPYSLHALRVKSWFNKMMNYKPKMQKYMKSYLQAHNP